MKFVKTQKGKILSGVIAMSMVMSQMTGISVYAQDTQDMIYTTQNIVEKGIANSPYAYNPGGTSVIKGNTTKYDIKLGDFVNMENWEYDWNNISEEKTDGSHAYKNNILIANNGIKYEIAVPFKDGSPKANGGKTFRYQKADDAGEPYYITLDIDDGHYKGVSFLGYNEEGNMPYIRYVYDDNTKSDWNALTTNSKYKSIETAPAEGDDYIKVPGGVWTKSDANSLTDCDLYLYQFTSMNVDYTKNLTAIELLSRDGRLPDMTADPVKSSAAYNRSFSIFGVTLLSDFDTKVYHAKKDYNAIKAQIEAYGEFDTSDELHEIMIKLVSEKEVLDSLAEEALIGNYFDAYDEISAICAEAENYINSYSGIMAKFAPFYLPVDYSKFVNAFRAYYLKEDGTGGSAFSSYAIKIDDFLNDTDKNYSWNETNDVLTFNGYKYSVKTVPSTDASTNVNLYTGKELSKTYEINIPAGYYNEISLLGGCEYNGSKMAVKLNYSDGTDTGYIDIENAKQLNKKGADGEDIALPMTGKDGNATCYLHQYKIAADPSKMLTSIEIPSGNASIENGVMTYLEKGNTYNCRVYGIGLKSNGVLQDKNKNISVSVDLAPYANHAKDYNSGQDALNTSGYALTLDGMKKLSGWKEAFNDAATTVQTNVLTLNDVEYLIRIPHTEARGDYTSKLSYAVNQDPESKSSSTRTTGFREFEVKRGYYKSVSFLGAAYDQGKTVTVRFNYSDGTSSKWAAGNIAKATVSSNACVAVEGKHTASGSTEPAAVYLHQLEIANPNTSKEVKSISICGILAKIVDGEVTLAYNGAHDVKILAVTMLSNEELKKSHTLDESTDPIAVFVSPEGNDENNGEETAPVKTIEQAVNLAKTKQENSVNDRKVIITLADGEYEITSTVLIDSFKAGVEIAAADGANPAVKASKTLNMSDAQDENSLKVFDLTSYTMPESILTEENSQTSLYTMNVFSNNDIMPIAGYPNNNELVSQTVASTTANESVSFAVSDANGKAELEKVSGEADVVLEGYLRDNYNVVKSTDYTYQNGTLTVNNLLTSNYPNGNLKRNWRISNSLKLLDAPGEWYVDKAAKKLYYYPRENEQSIDFSTLTDVMLKINCDNVTIKNITFKNSPASALSISGNGINVSDCDFYAIGGTAINADGTGAVITGNRLKNIGYRGIKISGGNENTLAESGNVVSENVIDTTGKVIRCYSEAIRAEGVGNVIEHNEINNNKSIAIFFTGSKNVIRNNILTNVCSEADDTGAIYSGRNLTYLNNEIYNNKIVISTERPQTTTPICGIYLDDALSGTTVHNNLIENARMGVFTNGGQQNTINTNLFVNCENGVYVGSTPMGQKVGDTPIIEHASTFFAQNAAYKEQLTNIDFDKLTSSDFKPGAVVKDNRFVNCTVTVTNPDLKHNGVTYSSELTESGNANASNVNCGLAEADIDTNRIGIESDEIDTTIGYAAIANNRVSAYFVSTYNDYCVIAAVKDADNRLLKAQIVSDGDSFEAPAGADHVDIFVFDNLNNIRPMTKK